MKIKPFIVPAADINLQGTAPALYFLDLRVMVVTENEGRTIIFKPNEVWITNKSATKTIYYNPMSLEEKDVERVQMPGFYTNALPLGPGQSIRYAGKSDFLALQVAAGLLTDAPVEVLGVGYMQLFE